MAERRNEPPLKEIVEKNDFIKFRDPNAEEYMRKRVARQAQERDRYEFKLFEFRASQ